MALGALPFACLALYLDDPATGGLYPSCPFRASTGLDCPGCGTGRALHQVLHGRFGDAFSLNPLAVLMLPVLLYATTWTASVALRGQPLPVPTLPRWAPWVLLAAVLVFAVLRNLPVDAVAWMASYR